MKTIIKANTIVIQSAIPAEDFNALNRHGVFNVQDENGDTLYAVERGNFGNINDFSFTANTEFQGKLTASMITDEPIGQVLEDLKPALVALKTYEQVIEQQVLDLKETLASVDEDIFIED